MVTVTNKYIIYITMWIVLFCFLTKVWCVFCLNLYHEGSKVTFVPDDSSEYFGYSVLLTDRLIVGAPKARSSLTNSISPGQVFFCQLNNLNTRNVTCSGLGSTTAAAAATSQRLAPNLFKDDIWFGATIATLSTDRLLICAPRWSTPYKDKHLLVNGLCHIHTQRRGATLFPLKEKSKQAFVTDGGRKEYGDYGTFLNFYAYGMSGFSAKVTDNSSIIIGAPGLLQWTGGIVEYKFNEVSSSLHFEQKPITNPYFTSDLGPDDYFGYSVESGVFEANGTVLFIAGAPRSKSGYGQVLIFEPAHNENDPLTIRAKMYGPQLGSYFGATLCCVDVNGDGINDLLVGAPNYIKRDVGLPYDQGAVFIYLTQSLESNFSMNAVGYVFGSGESGSRFGSAIAELGDVDGDGYVDVAIGSPWENGGRGAVYIYKGGADGLKKQFIQKISADGAASFGISISKGLDVDKNGCNDLAVGAHRSQSVYVFRCIPTMDITVAIKVPDAMNLEENASKFTAIFCVKATPKKKWMGVKIDLMASIDVDPEQNRATISEYSEYNITILEGTESCGEQTVDVMSTADLSKPITIKFNVQPIEILKEYSTSYSNLAARVSEESVLQTSFDIQLMRGCGDDLVCRPLLHMSFEPLNNPYIPGTQQRLGVIVRVSNAEEPSFGATVLIRLPTSLKRQPPGCVLEGYARNMTCALPSPLLKSRNVEWEIELEYTPELDNNKINVEAELIEPVRNNQSSYKKDIHIEVTPKANFSISGKALPNATITVTREKINEAGNVAFVHYFEITNIGPSDWFNLSAKIVISQKVKLSSPIKGCSKKSNLDCNWHIPAKTSLPIIVALRVELGLPGIHEHDNIFKNEPEYNVSSTVNIYHENKVISASIVTTLSREPAPPLWPVIVGSISGLLLLSGIVYVLKKCGFFSRNLLDDRQVTNEPNLQLQGRSLDGDDANTFPSVFNKSSEDLFEDSD